MKNEDRKDRRIFRQVEITERAGNDPLGNLTTIEETCRYILEAAGLPGEWPPKDDGPDVWELVKKHEESAEWYATKALIQCSGVS